MSQTFLLPEPEYKSVSQKTRGKALAFADKWGISYHAAKGILQGRHDIPEEAARILVNMAKASRKINARRRDPVTGRYKRMPNA